MKSDARESLRVGTWWRAKDVPPGTRITRGEFAEMSEITPNGDYVMVPVHTAAKWKSIVLPLELLIVYFKPVREIR